MNISLPGYAIFRESSRDQKYVTYRGVREDDQKPVIIKTLAISHPKLDDIARLKNEYELLSHLELNSIVKTYALENFQNTYFLILEDTQEVTLDKFMRMKILDLASCMKIAINIAKVLADLQDHDVIHKDVQPENILINPTTLDIKLTGFTYATKIPRQRLTVKNIHLLEGTLAYMSPEQTGRMNREVDYRTDFYSLGVTLYQLFTNQLPFKTHDAMELVHSHIAKTPPSPHHLLPEIPEPISDIIMKLMAKKAEERYSSAYSLLHDLERSFSEWQAYGKVDTFTLGINDVYHRLQISQKIYGREKEIQQMMNAFQEVCEGSTQMMLLAGYPGIGKTSIVNEIHKPILEKKGFFISGKFDQYKTNIPYSGFIEAFQDLIQQVLTENDDIIAMWREKLKTALGTNANIIMDVIPELRYIIGDSAPSPDFDSQETQNRFNFFFQRFISLYATPENPLVIFLDDLQWVDQASSQLIEMVLTTLKTKGLFLIGAYRSNEVTPLHPLITAMQRIIRAGGQATEVEVPPLSLKSITQWIADSLHLSFDKCRSLCEIVYEKTHGNPFFTNQFMTYLNEEQLLYVDIKEGSWAWNLEKIANLDVSDNVVDLLITKLQKCSLEMQKILEVSACIGNHFDVRLLSMITEQPLSYVMKYLIEAIGEGFILSSEDIHHYLWIDPKELDEATNILTSSHSFRFLHDKVQQAAFQLMNEVERKQTNYKIGVYLLKKHRQDNLEEHIFEIMAHLNQAADLIKEPKEKKEYARLNLLGAQKAMRTVAYGTAMQFLKIGISFLEENPWQKEYELTLQLFLASAETNFLLFNFDEADRLFDIILQYAKSNHDKISAYTLKVKLNISSVNYNEAIKWGRTGLKMLGVNLPSKNLRLHVLKELLIVKAKLFRKEVESIANLPTINDPNHFDIIHLLVLLVPPSYLTNKELFAFVVLKGLNLSLKFGIAPMSAYIFASYGIILNVLFEDFKTSYTFGQLALELNRKFDDQKYISATKFLVGTFLNPAKNHLKSSIEILRIGYEQGTATGDFINAVFCLGMGFNDKYMIASPINDLRQEVIGCMDYVTKIRSHNRGYVFTAFKQVFMALRGETYNPSTMQTDDFNEEAFFQMLKDNNFPITLYFVYTYKIQLCYLFEHFEQVLEYIKKTDELTFCVIGQPMRLENDFYHALALAANYAWKDVTTQKIYKKKIKKILKRIHTWANAAPQNYYHKYLLIRAEFARLEGDTEGAAELYDEAIDAAKENGYTQNEGIANELFARFYLSQNRTHLAKQYLIDAHYAFYRWGASAKAAQLEHKYTGMFPVLSNRELDTFDTHTHTDTSMMENSQTSSALDLMAVIKATQTISGEIVLGRLIDELMRIVVETAGAEKAVLILEKESNWLVEAEYTTAQGKTLRPGIPFKEKKEDLSTAIVNFVIRTQEQIVLDDAANESIFITDPYIANTKPQSILCFPLLHQAKLVGVLYLENNLTTRAFTPARVEVLKLLSAQIATSLENSLLYSHQAELSDELKNSNEKLEDYSHNLEKKVYDRTRELNEKNKQLEETLQQIKEMQKKLIQQEKLVSMVAVTKSIATEMRNPLNYIYNFATLSQNLIDELKNANKSETATETLTIIQTNLKKIYEHSKKADDIITSMLQQSRESEGQREAIDINKLIRDYADLVYYSYYKKDPLFSLTLETDYDPSIGPINCYPQNLGRVFYNIIDNACYATDLKKKEIGGNFSPIVSIHTKNSLDNVIITIRDNGIGIPQDVLSRVFSPFLTTKPAGKGAGMGLSISHDIIVQDHEGKIEIDSSLGEFTEVKITLPKL